MANKFNVIDATGIYGRTTDGDFNTLASLTIPEDSVVLISVRLVAIRTDETQGAGYTRFGTFRNSSGTVTQIGSTTSVATHEDDSTWDFQFLVSGTEVAIQVKGNPGKIINWRGDHQALRVGLGDEYV